MSIKVLILSKIKKIMNFETLMIFEKLFDSVGLKVKDKPGPIWTCVIIATMIIVACIIS